MKSYRFDRSWNLEIDVDGNALAVEGAKTLGHNWVIGAVE
jgi:hypothetical protein